jgi:hypothetical protein
LQCCIDNNIREEYLSKQYQLAMLAPLCLSLFAPGAFSQDGSHPWDHRKIKHVLLISIDGMHGVDYLTCTQGVSAVDDGTPFCPNLSSLGDTGVNYVDAYTPKPSDSFPGLTAIVSGGSPRTEGVYYDVAYDRSLDPPAKTTGNGVAAGTCVAGADPTGTRTEYEEGIDRDQTKLNGGAPGAGLSDGGVHSIDTARLIRDPKKNCEPVYPWNFVRTNTIFGVIHEAGGFTAWSDKHPAYLSVSGPGNGANVNDFYGPEINSTVVGLPGVVTPDGLACTSIPDPSQTASWTDSFLNIKCYDTLKVNAIVNEIDGETHDGKKSTVPVILGMNFQAVSVGQKLIEKGFGSGGYLDGAGTPSKHLLSEIEFVDDSIGRMVAELKKEGLYDSTLVIITAKHGQSPIDPKRFFPIPGHSGGNGVSPSTLIADLLPYSESPSNPTGIGPTEDDVSLLWLADSSQTGNAVDILEEHAREAGIGEIFYGSTVALTYHAPGLPPDGDPRTPDIIVTPNAGVIYTGSTAKQEEHGGFGHDDTNVMMLLSNPAFTSRTVAVHVDTVQVAPTILKALGLEPSALEAVRIEGTAVLPGLRLE